MQSPVNTSELRALLGSVSREYLHLELSDEELWKLFRAFKQIEVATAISVGGFLTYGIDSVTLVPSKRMHRPYLRRKTSQMVHRAIQARPDLCRTLPSQDQAENVRRILQALSVLYPPAPTSTVPNPV